MSSFFIKFFQNAFVHFLNNQVIGFKNVFIFNLLVKFILIVIVQLIKYNLVFFVNLWNQHTVVCGATVLQKNSKDFPNIRDDSELFVAVI